MGKYGRKSSANKNLLSSNKVFADFTAFVDKY